MPATAQFTQELPTQSIHLQNATPPFAPARTTWTGPPTHYLHSPFKEQIADHETGTKDDGGKKAECRARNAQTNEQKKEISRRQPPSERCCATPVLKLLADGRALVTRSLVSERATTGIVASSQVELPTRGPSEKGEGGHQKCARFQRRPSYDGPNSAAK